MGVSEEVEDYLAFQGGQHGDINQMLGIREKNGVTELLVEFSGFEDEELVWKSAQELLEDVTALVRQYIAEASSNGTKAEREHRVPSDKKLQTTPTDSTIGVMGQYSQLLVAGKNDWTAASRRLVISIGREEWKWQFVERRLVIRHVSGVQCTLMPIVIWTGVT